MNLYPDIVLRSVREITPEWMKLHSLGGLLLDLDNTLAGYHINEPHPDIHMWINALQMAGYQLIVLSNARAERVAAFCEPLKLPYVAKAKKPGKTALLNACERIGLLPQNIAMVGDQIFTDVLSANRAGVMSVIVEPLTHNFFFKFRRNVIEQRFVTGRSKK